MSGLFRHAALSRMGAGTLGDLASTRIPEDPFSLRLIKKVQMQGGVTHPSDGYPGLSEAYSGVRRSERPSAPTPQMGLFHSLLRKESHAHRL
ncbi:MAG TPA: hypothetical protein VEU07_04810, partial [Candidatus Acidoferrum sp.]|nr:hypothetical protein [Candidatus Acidoferrum sp.]